jgi:hypothetical protein
MYARMVAQLNLQVPQEDMLVTIGDWVGNFLHEREVYLVWVLHATKSFKPLIASYLTSYYISP